MAAKHFRNIDGINFDGYKVAKTTKRKAEQDFKVRLTKAPEPRHLGMNTK